MLEFGKKIPITIHPAFWIFAALIGYINSFSLVGTLVWIGVIFISVLFHELGHALTALSFGKKARIELIALGGLTFHDTKNLSKLKQFLIVLNGPLFGFVLFILASLFLYRFPHASAFKLFLLPLVWVNLFWTVINLLPILPLDGGQLVRIALEGFFGVKGVRYALFVSMFVGGLIALLGFLYGAYLLGALVFLFAFQSFDSFRKSAKMREVDQKEEIKKALFEAEMLIAKGDTDGAIQALQHFREDAKEGLLFDVATQDLAFLFFKENKFNEVYFLLKPLLKDLTDEATVLLHNAAFEMGDYAMVNALSGSVYERAPSFENALRNAKALASIGNIAACLGWLETASEFDADLKKELENPLFDPVRNSDAFRSFAQSL